MGERADAEEIDRLREQLERAQGEIVYLASFPQLDPNAVVEMDYDGQIRYLNPAALELFPDCFLPGPRSPLLADLPGMIQMLQSQSRQGEPTYQREMQMGDRWYQQVLRIVPNLDRLRSFVIDITERKRVEAALQRQNGYLEALHETTLGMMSRHDLDELLQAIIVRAAELLGTTHGFVCLQREGEDEIEQKVGTGAFANTVGNRLRPGEGVSGRVWQTGTPLVVDDYASFEARATNFDYSLISAMAAVPLKSGDRVIGAIQRLA
jgi:PAS domain-containing protein